MSTVAQRIVLFSAIAIWIIGYNFWQIAWHGFFYHCMAVSILLFAVFIRDIVKDRWLSIGANVSVAVGINNLLDELFFNPLEFRFNEYILIFISILIIYRNVKQRQ